MNVPQAIYKYIACVFHVMIIFSLTSAFVILFLYKIIPTIKGLPIFVSNCNRGKFGIMPNRGSMA